MSSTGWECDERERGAIEDARDTRYQHQLENDAARYRWIRDVGFAPWGQFGILEGYSEEKADAIIDAAIANAKSVQK